MRVVDILSFDALVVTLCIVLQVASRISSAIATPNRETLHPTLNPEGIQSETSLLCWHSIPRRSSIKIYLLVSLTDLARPSLVSSRPRRSRLRPYTIQTGRASSTSYDNLVYKANTLLWAKTSTASATWSSLMYAALPLAAQVPSCVTARRCILRLVLASDLSLCITGWAWMDQHCITRLVLRLSRGHVAIWAITKTRQQPANDPHG